MKELGLYIHIPFCIKKCYYCDFNSYSNNENKISTYINCLIKEIERSKEELRDYKIKSIFIGGGTPSILSIKELDKVLSELYKSFNLKKDLEFSIESNPGTLDKEKLNYYLNNGINRLSIGLQAWQNKLLNKLGRIHNIEEFKKNYMLARDIGFKNINIDLMFGLPNQTINDFKETLKNVVKLNPEHISDYSLKIEKGTVFKEKYNNGKLILPSEEEDREMYHFSIEYLKENGYKHYEISNFSKENKECSHNIVYWKNQQYIGLGLGSHSYLNRERFSNVYNLDKYIDLFKNNKEYVDQKEIISKEDEIAETMFLGLRMIEGININEFIQKFDLNPLEIFHNEIDKLLNQKLIIIDKEYIKLSYKGIDLSNQVFINFLSPNIN